MTNDLRHRLRSLAIYVVGPRLDHEFMVDALVSYFRTGLNDFWLTHAGDNSEGFASPSDRKIWWERRLAEMQAWPAQDDKSLARMAQTRLIPEPDATAGKD